MLSKKNLKPLSRAILQTRPRRESPPAGPHTTLPRGPRTHSLSSFARGPAREHPNVPPSVDQSSVSDQRRSAVAYPGATRRYRYLKTPVPFEMARRCARIQSWSVARLIKASSESSSAWRSRMLLPSVKIRFEQNGCVILNLA